MYRFRPESIRTSNLEEDKDSCEEIDDTSSCGSLASSYDAEVARQYDFQEIETELNKFHKDAIKNMKYKSTAKFQQINALSSLSLKK